MQSINTEQNQRERIRIVRKNKIWELALVGLIGIVIGGLIVWGLLRSSAPPPTPDFSQTQLKEPPVTVQLVAATQKENSISADLKLIAPALADQEIKVKADPKTEPTTVRTDGEGKATVSIIYSPSEKERLITVTRNGTEVGRVNFPLPKIEPRTVEKPPVVPPPVTIAVTRTALEEDDRIRAELEISVDKNGKPQSEIQVQLTSTRGNADTLIFEKNNRTDQQGRVKVQLTSKQFGSRTIAVTHNGEPVGQDEIYLPKIEPRTEIKTEIKEKVVVVPPPIEIEVRRMVEEDNRIRADLELTVKKEKEDPRADVPLQLTSTQGSDRFTFEKSNRTDGQGKVSAQLTAGQFGPRKITVTSNGEQLGQVNFYLPEVSPRVQIVEKPVEPPPQPTKRLVRLKVEGSDNVPLTDATVKISGKPVKANNDGVFETEVGKNQNAVEVEVERDGYETPQGESTYKRSLLLNVVEAQVYLFTVALSPVLYSVEVPSEALEVLPDDPNVSLDRLRYGFYVKSSLSDPLKVKANLTTDRRRLLFPFDSSLKLNEKSIWIEIRQGNRRDPLWREKLPFREVR